MSDPISPLPVSPEALEFLATIKANPTDHLIRLVFADYLDERGESDLAAYLRLTTELIRSPTLATNERLAEEAEALGTRLCEHLKRYAPKGIEWRFDRDLCMLNCEPTLAAFAELEKLAAQPVFAWIGKVSLDPGSDDMAIRVARSPWFARVLSLTLHQGTLTDVGLRALAVSPHLGRLKSLDVWKNEFTAGGVADLANSMHLPNLEALDLGFNGIGNIGIEWLVAGRGLPKLHDLTLNYTQCDRTCLAMLAAWPKFAQLTRFRLGGVHMTSDDLQLLVLALKSVRELDLYAADLDSHAGELLVQLPTRRTLEVLALDSNNLSDEGMVQLAKQSWDCLRELTFSHSYIGAIGAEALAESGHFLSLVQLGMVANRLGPEGVQALARHGRLPALRSLDVSLNNLGNEGLESVLRTDRLPALRTLTSFANDHGDATASAVAESPGLARLTDLGLQSNSIGPDGIAALARSPHTASLRSLTLYQNPIGNDGAKSLADAKNLCQLRSVDLHRCSIGPLGVRSLIESEAFPRLTTLNLERNLLSHATGQAILQAQWLDQLEHLSLSSAGLSPEQQAALRERFGDRVNFNTENVSD